MQMQTHTRAQADKDMQLVTHSCTGIQRHAVGGTLVHKGKHTPGDQLTHTHTHTCHCTSTQYSSLSFFPSPGRVKDDSRSMRGSNRGFMKHGPGWGQSGPSLQQLMSMPHLKNVPQGGRQGQCNAPKRIPPRM